MKRAENSNDEKRRFMAQVSLAVFFLAVVVLYSLNIKNVFQANNFQGRQYSQAELDMNWNNIRDEFSQTVDKMSAQVAAQEKEQMLSQTKPLLNSFVTDINTQEKYSETQAASAGLQTLQGKINAMPEAVEIKSVEDKKMPQKGL